MKKSIVCEKMRRGEIILTAKLNFMNPNLAELIGYFGFDCTGYSPVPPVSSPESFLASFLYWLGVLLNRFLNWIRKWLTSL